MDVAKFQQLNPDVCADGLFALEQAATLSRLELTDDTMTTQGKSSCSRHRVVIRK